MPIHGAALALDLGTTCGFCCGPPGSKPIAGSVLLKKRDEHRSIAFGNMMWFLWSLPAVPTLVVKERMITSYGEGRKTSDAAVRIHGGLHAIVEGYCVRNAIPFDPRQHDVDSSTWRKHFLGQGRWPDPEMAKLAAERRAKALGLMSADVANYDAAEAIGMWDWACAVFARRATFALS